MKKALFVFIDKEDNFPAESVYIKYEENKNGMAQEEFVRIHEKAWKHCNNLNSQISGLPFHYEMLDVFFNIKTI
jgi:hypothetical protein